MRVAFIHDWLLGMRGGEKVLEAALEVFPDADVFTLLHSPKRISETINRRSIRTSWLQRLPGVRRYYRYLLPLMPQAIERFDLDAYNVVLSSSHCVAKGIRTRKEDGRRPLHICYCHTPMRYIYDQFENYFPGKAKPWLRSAANIFRPYLARWDLASSRRVDLFIANSKAVRERIQKAYGRDAAVIYPPVDVEFFGQAPPEAAPSRPYYLVVSALVPYKRVDIAIEACRRVGARLRIVGEGTEMARLKSLARDSQVEFLGWQSAEVVRESYHACSALLFPQEEDFGIAAVEAMACGKPVIAYGRGGALETVLEGKTGVLFAEQTAESLAAAMLRSQTMRFDAQAIREHAGSFNRDAFKSRLADFVREAWKRRQAARRRRIMQVVECGGPGGTGYQVSAICNGLDPSRFEVQLAYSVRRGSSPAEYEALTRGARSFHHVPEMVREIMPFLDILAWLRLYRLFRRLKPDVVHAHSSKAGFLARTAAWAAGIPRIYYSPRGYSFLQTDRGRLSRLLYRSLERAISWIGEVVAVSESEAELARKVAWARNVRVVRDAYLGEIERDPVSPLASGGPVLICASGRLSYPRHPEAFARLARRLSDCRAQARCVWIGGGELERELRELIRDLGLDGKLELTGWLSREDALARLRQADVLVHYSRWEGLPNAVLEAMALGKPVVASDIPANRELVKDQENGFLARGEKELFERAVQLVDDPALRARLGERGRAIVRAEYSRERLMRELSELYAAAP